MPRQHNINGNKVPFTEAEETARNAEELTFANGALDRELKELRNKRNKLLSDTDFHANSDLTMSSAMTTYRQALRDLPSGLDTVEKVNAKQFPTKP